MRGRILVIDDDPSIPKSFLLALEDTQVEVDTADSGEEGLAVLRAGSYDLVPLDLRMPGTDGVETLRRCLEGRARRGARCGSGLRGPAQAPRSGRDPGFRARRPRRTDRGKGELVVSPRSHGACRTPTDMPAAGTPTAVWDHGHCDRQARRGTLGLVMSASATMQQALRVSVCTPGEERRT